MPTPPDDTCWSLLRAASDGDSGARDRFARSYTSPVRAYLAHRWRGGRLAEHLDDAMQDVFVECMKPGGVIERADPASGDFRALLYGVVRNIARRHEQRHTPPDQAVGGSVHLDDLPADAEALSQFFDRSWAKNIVRDAVSRHARAARRGDPDMQRRHRILQLRHHDDLPIREIALRLGESDVDAVHNAYRRARREFRVHLREAVALHTGARPDELDATCRRVTDLLGS